MELGELRHRGFRVFYDLRIITEERNTGYFAEPNDAFSVRVPQIGNSVDE